MFTWWQKKQPKQIKNGWQNLHFYWQTSFQPWSIIYVFLFYINSYNYLITRRCDKLFKMSHMNIKEYNYEK